MRRLTMRAVAFSVLATITASVHDRPASQIVIKGKNPKLVTEHGFAPTSPVLIIMAANLLMTSSRQTSSIAPAVVRSEFLSGTAPLKSVHASTIVETGKGLVAAWYGGSREGADDVGIWMALQVKGRWTSPVEVATGKQPDGTRYPCWNPVLFDMPDRTLVLFYKVGPNPRSWWGMTRTSRDSGRTWSDVRRLPNGILGPIKNKPVRLSDGSVISPASTESPDLPSRWRVHFERTVDAGQTWTVIHPPESADRTEIDAIQPSILIHSGGRLQAVGRTQSQRIFETWSTDGGRTWTPLSLTVLLNPNSGTDAVALRDGRHLLVYNHSTLNRSPLNVALSSDGKIWEAAIVLEGKAGEYSYPAVIQTSDNFVHITYTWQRQRIKHVVIDPKRLDSIPMPEGKWPSGVR